MRDALNVFWQSLRDWYYGMISLAVMNLLWFGGALTIVLVAPATAGIYSVAYSTARGTGQHFSDFWQAARRDLGLSLRWLVLNLLVVVIFVVNVSFYGSASSTLAKLILVAVITFALFWVAIQLYVWPFLMIQEDRRLRVALRNAAYLVLATPVYTLTLLSGALLALILSLAVIAPLALFLTSFLAVLGSRAVIDRLQAFGKLPGPTTPSTNGDPL